MPGIGAGIDVGVGNGTGIGTGSGANGQATHGTSQTQLESGYWGTSLWGMKGV